MTLYNTLVPVVAVIEAKSRADAVRRLHDALTGAGFDVYDDPGCYDAFESEEGTEPSVLPGA